MNEVMQIIESNKNAGSGSGTTSTPIQLDISKGATLNVGDTTTYDISGNMMKVTKMRGVTVSVETGGPANFDFYIHSLANGGKFTLNQTINHGDNKNGTLEGVSNSISDVYEVYYYVKTADNNGALKIKTSSDAKIFYNENITDNTKTWTEYTGGSDPDLGPLVNKIKEGVEIKCDKTVIKSILKGRKKSYSSDYGRGTK